MAKFMIARNYQRVVERIRETALRSGRDPQSVELVVVTKAHPIQAIRQVIQAGARRLGENYLEEALEKMQALSGQQEIEWHMVGHIQSRKAQPVCENFAWVHSLDSVKLARRLNRFAGQLERLLPVLLEFNVSGEESKYGWQASDKKQWPALIEEVAKIAAYPHLEIHGLMTMAPYLSDAELARPYFIRLRELRDYFRSQFPQADWEELSMGMSDDFEIAIQEGATIVRIGTAIMGPRT
jgi:pyridoxal phosphate enzyme (YggS family)